MLNQNMYKPIYLLYAVLSLIFACSDSTKINIKQVTCTGSSHSYSDTIVSVDLKDTLYDYKYLYLAHHISFDENGDGILITRNDYEAPRQFYSIKVADSLKKVVFSLLKDTSVLNFKQPAFDPDKEARIYCGYNYLISSKDDESHENYINYLPPDANEKLKQLHTAFKLILHNPNIVGKAQIDTLTLDSTILEKVIYLNPKPPIRSKLKFTPPSIDPDLDTKH
jgi:hypothetical protein